MNFLAHAWLAGDSPADRLGALIGDFVKGPLPAGLPADLAAGVKLHRQVDRFADEHPVFQHSRQRVSQARRRYAGIMVDMFYDHFLALHWHRFSASPLEGYVADLYDAAQRQLALLPARFHRTLGYMRQENWLLSYRQPEAISLTLERLAEYRLRQPNGLYGGGEELLTHYAGFEADFFVFIADAKRQCESWLQEGRGEAGR